MPSHPHKIMLPKQTTATLIFALVLSLTYANPHANHFGYNPMPVDPYNYSLLEQQMLSDPKLQDPMHRIPLYRQQPQRQMMPNPNVRIVESYEPMIPEQPRAVNIKGINVPRGMPMQDMAMYQQANAKAAITPEMIMPVAEKANVITAKAAKPVNDVIADLNNYDEALMQAQMANQPMQNINANALPNTEVIVAPAKTIKNIQAAKNVAPVVIPEKVQIIAANNKLNQPPVDLITNDVAAVNTPKIIAKDDTIALKSPIVNTPNKIDIVQQKQIQAPTVVVDAVTPVAVQKIETSAKQAQVPVIVADAAVPTAVQKVEAVKTTVVAVDQPARVILDQKQTEIIAVVPKVDTAQKQEIDKIVAAAKPDDLMIDSNGRPFLKAPKYEPKQQMMPNNIDANDQMSNMNATIDTKNKNRIYEQEAFNSVSTTRSRQMDYSNESMMIAAFLNDLRHRQMMYYYGGMRY